MWKFSAYCNPKYTGNSHSSFPRCTTFLQNQFITTSIYTQNYVQRKTGTLLPVCSNSADLSAFWIESFLFQLSKKKKATIKDSLLLWFCWKGFEELVGMWTNDIKEQKCQSHGRKFTNNSFNRDVCHYKGHKSEISPYSTAFLLPSSKNYF